MPEKINIVGTGGLAKELIAYIVDETEARYEINGAWSDLKFNSPAYEHFYRGTIDDLIAEQSDYPCLLAIAEPKGKKIVVSRFPDTTKWLTYIHPSANVSSFSSVGKGCVIAPLGIVTGDASLGDFVFFNTSAVIGHDSTIGTFSTLYPNTEVCGNCHIGESCTFGIGSYTVPDVTLPDGCSIGAGSIVWKSPEQSGLLIGNPAEMVKVYQ